jgi:YVTN family beta-propeller protein
VNCNCFSGIGAGTVSVIDTASNTVVGTPIPVGGEPEGVAVTPDGKHAYVTNAAFSIGSVSVIDTAANTVGDTIPVGTAPFGVAVTPDGKDAYVANLEDNTVSVIDTATNTVVGTPITVGSFPLGVGIIPPPPGVPFLAFNAVLNIAFGSAPNTDAFTLGTGFTLSSTAPMFNPLTDPVTLQIGTFAVTIPAGSFNETGKGIFSFEGVINGVTMKAMIKSTGTLRYNFQAGAQHASLTGTQNAVYVTLAIGGDSGATSVTAMIFQNGTSACSLLSLSFRLASSQRSPMAPGFPC